MARYDTYRDVDRYGHPVDRRTATGGDVIRIADAVRLPARHHPRRVDHLATVTLLSGGA